MEPTRYTVRVREPDGDDFRDVPTLKEAVRLCGELRATGHDVTIVERVELTQSAGGWTWTERILEDA